MAKNFTSPIPSAIGNQPKPKKQPVHNQKIGCDNYAATHPHKERKQGNIRDIESTTN
jgi:hypothetical protein